MLYEIAADVVVLLHLLFIVYAMLGGLLLLRWPASLWLHLPMACWAALVELAGWGCPLTPLERWLREMAGAERYTGGFVEHYILPLIYPGELTRGIQIVLGFVVVVFNVAVYTIVWRRRRPR